MCARKFFVVSLNFFGSTSTISRFGEHFRDGQYSLVFCLLLFYSQLVFSFPGARDSRPFSFLDSRELKRRYSQEKRERVKDSLNETPGSDYSAFKRQLLVS